MSKSKNILLFILCSIVAGVIIGDFIIEIHQVSGKHYFVNKTISW
jgi:uncharacterized membrane protein YwzB